MPKRILSMLALVGLVSLTGCFHQQVVVDPAYDATKTTPDFQKNHIHILGAINLDNQVALEEVCPNGAAMVEIGQNFECLGDDRVAFCALDMRDHADPAGVVFVTRIVKTRGGLGRRASHQRCVLLRARPPASHGVRGSREHGRAVPITAPAKLREGS